MSRHLGLVLAALALGGCYRSGDTVIDDPEEIGPPAVLDDAGSPPFEEDALAPVVAPVEAPACGRAAEWVAVESGVETDLNAVRVASATEAWVAGDGGALYRFDGAALTPVEGPPTTDDLGELWIDPDGGIWVTTLDAAFHRTDAGWERLPVAPPGDGVITALWGTAANDVWLGGGTASPQTGFLAHWDGARITFEDAPTEIQVTELRGGDRAFGVAHLGRLMRREPGGSWARFGEPDGQTITSVWPAGPDEAFFGALYAQIHHYRDGVWTTWDSGALNTYYYAIWGCDRDDVWAVGWEGSVARFDGTGLTAIVRPRPTRATLHAIDGRPGGLVVAVGEGGTVLRLDAAGPR